MLNLAYLRLPTIQHCFLPMREYCLHHMHHRSLHYNYRYVQHRTCCLNMLRNVVLCFLVQVHLDFEVNAYFYPNESWYRPKLCNENTLAHEQLHFDITEIFARKMRDKLQRTSFSDDVKAEVRKIYNDILKELQEYQERYDWETNFSRNREKQAEWNQKIAETLKESE